MFENFRFWYSEQVYKQKVFDKIKYWFYMIFGIIIITEKSRIINVFYNKFLNSRAFFRFQNIRNQIQISKY
jgi:hypothetical protein